MASEYTGGVNFYRLWDWFRRDSVFVYERILAKYWNGALSLFPVDCDFVDCEVCATVFNSSWIYVAYGFLWSELPDGVCADLGVWCGDEG